MLRLFCFLFIISPFALAEISLIEPRLGARLIEGEINIQWQRDVDDKSPVRLEVRSKRNQFVVLERTTIGTRRTKWMSPGTYEVRLSKNAKVKDQSWREFTVVARDSGYGEVSKKRPLKRAEKDVVKAPKSEEDINFFDEMVIVKKHIVDQAKKPESLEVLKWFAPEKNSRGQVQIRVQFRARNTFGELKAQDLLYVLKEQRILEVQNLKAID